ncbi:MAG: M1 family metallopeptidase [Ilumatobacteraceae bacterium]
MSHLSNPHRLPRTVLPNRYELSLSPNLASASFTGTVSIECEAVEAADEIVLNAKELEIHSVRVNGGDAPFHVHEGTERLVVATGVAPGAVSLEISFTGVLNDKLRGWYRSTFTDESGTEQVIATTQMQSTDCRRAFPCFDEPDMKAVFAIDLTVEDGLFAISNGPETKRELVADGKVRIWFGDTMSMSTYLVAFIVGPLEATAPQMVNGTPVRVVHVPGKGHLTDFGMKVGTFALDWFEKYYGIPYPAEKVDLVALPDFAAGAMENLGCITFREVLLLVDPATSTQIEQELVADVVAHELAHMWFGDLVTMRWWNGIWLNEAFATFMEIAACDAFAPDWKRWTSFGLERSLAFEVDSLKSTRSVEFPVNAPDDAEGMFDVLTYQKGGAILRMLEQYLGAERFRAGVSHYLKMHALGNTETNDLWDAIEETVSTDGGEKVPVRRLMDSFIWQPGYPLVSARIDGSDLVLSQCRFTFDNDPDATIWVLPVHVRNAGVETKILMEGPDARVRLADSSAAVVVNAGGHGFFRVAYSPELLARLDGTALARMEIIERYNLVDDAWNAVTAGNLSAVDFLAFAGQFTAERDLAVWQALAIGLRGVGRLLGREHLDSFAVKVRELAAPALADLGADARAGEPDLTAKLRGLLVGLLAISGRDESLQARCRAIVADPDAEGVDPELVAAATTVVAAVGGVDDYEWVLERFRNPETPQEQIRMLYALAEFDDPDLMRRTCELAFTGEVKTQNAPFLLNRCIANRFHGELAWSIVRQHWQEANEKFPVNTIVRMVDSAKMLNSDAAEADVQAFFGEHDIPQAVLTLQQVLERQRVNAALRRREADALAADLT